MQRLRAAKDLTRPLLNRHREAQQRVNAAKAKVQKAEIGLGELQKELQDLQAKVRDGYEKHAILKSALEAEEAKLESVLREPQLQPTAPAAASIAGSLPSLAELQALPVSIRESHGLSPTILENVAKAVALAAAQRLELLQQKLIQQDAESAAATAVHIAQQNADEAVLAQQKLAAAALVVDVEEVPAFTQFNAEELAAAVAGMQADATEEQRVEGLKLLHRHKPY